MNKGVEKLILYPREYNKRGESSLHSVLGVTQDGELVNVKLRISDEFSNVRNAPSIQEFSRTDRKAKSPAIASPDNSPSNPEGIILFTGAFFEKEDRQKGVKSYIASWAHVLREDSDSGEPHLGIGRIKVKKDNTMVHRNIKKKLSGNVTEDERKSLLSRLEDPKSFDYSLILYLPSSQLALNKESDYTSSDYYHNDLFNDYYSKGVSFGYYRIICDHDMNPIPNKSKEFLSRYSSITGDIDSPNEFLEKFIPHVTNEINQNGGVILIPCYRLNPTSSGKNYYSYPDRLSMIDSVFKNEEGYARANMLAVKVVNLGGRGIIFDRAHPLNYHKLNLDLLDSHGKESRLYSSNMTLSHNNSELHSIRIGLIEHNTFLKISQPSPSGCSPFSPEGAEPEVISLVEASAKSSPSPYSPTEVNTDEHDQEAEVTVTSAKEGAKDMAKISEDEKKQEAYPLTKAEPPAKSLSDDEGETSSDSPIIAERSADQDSQVKLSSYSLDSDQSAGMEIEQEDGISEKGVQDPSSNDLDGTHRDELLNQKTSENISNERTTSPSTQVIDDDGVNEVTVDDLYEIQSDSPPDHDNSPTSSEDAVPPPAVSDLPSDQGEAKNKPKNSLSPTGMAAFLKRKR